MYFKYDSNQKAVSCSIAANFADYVALQNKILAENGWVVPFTDWSAKTPNTEITMGGFAVAKIAGNTIQVYMPSAVKVLTRIANRYSRLYFANVKVVAPKAAAVA